MLKYGTEIRLLSLMLLGITVVWALLFPTCAWATVEGDQIPLTEEEISSAIANEELPFLSSQSTRSSFAASNAENEAIKVFAGETRYETSAQQALAGWESSQTAILVSGDGWADALGASGLAGALDCPILLTKSDSLPDVVRDALVELGVSKVIILGGQTAVSSSVEVSIKDAGISDIERLGGSTRYDTQLNIYQYGKEGGLWNADTVIVANGASDNFADALSVSPIAFTKKAPIFIVDTSGMLSDDQEAVLIEGAAEGSFSHVVMVGGTARISDYTAGFLEGIAIYGASDQDHSCIRIAGETRYETSAQLASWAMGEGLLSADGAGFASANVPYDALGGGALQGHNGSVLLLISDGSYGAAVDALNSVGGVETISFFGGNSAISDSTKKSVSKNLGFSVALRVYIDAGHGYDSSNDGLYDVGAVGSGYQEADLTKELARLVAAELSTSYGVDVCLNDYGGWYKLRHAEAEYLGCDLLVSIHFNSGGGTGCESYIHSRNAAVGSVDLQGCTHPELVKGMALYDRGMKADQFAVVSGSLPAVLLEVGFIDSEYDMRQYQERKDIVARNIAKGIMDYAG